MYCSHADVEISVGGSIKLIELADQDQNAIADTDVIDAAIARGQATIDSYLAGQFSVPLASAPESVRWATAAEAAFVLRDQRSAHTPETLAAHATMIAWLEAVNKGTVKLDVDPMPTAHSMRRDKVVEVRGTNYASRVAFLGWS